MAIDTITDELITDKVVAEHMLAVLVMDLGYKNAPRNGFDPLRHQFAWSLVSGIIGKTDREKQIEDMIEQLAIENAEMAAGICECHERDSSYTCSYCQSQGYFGHMQQHLQEQWDAEHQDEEI